MKRQLYCYCTVVTVRTAVLSTVLVRTCSRLPGEDELKSRYSVGLQYAVLVRVQYGAYLYDNTVINTVIIEEHTFHSNLKIEGEAERGSDDSEPYSYRYWELSTRTPYGNTEYDTHFGPRSCRH